MTNSLKLYEYLASGRPVVGTRIRPLEEFAGLVSLASNPTDWSAAMAEALRPGADTPECRATCLVMARQHDWQIFLM